MVFQVKSGHVGRGDIAKLKGDMQREKAALATLITLEEPTPPMLSAAKSAGFYTHSLTGHQNDRIELVTIRDMLENGRRLNLPLSMDAIRKAELSKPIEEQGFLIDPPTRKSPSPFKPEKPHQRDLFKKSVKSEQRELFDKRA